jgi:hypothetical protein
MAASAIEARRAQSLAPDLVIYSDGGCLDLLDETVHKMLGLFKRIPAFSGKANNRLPYR